MSQLALFKDLPAVERVEVEPEIPESLKLLMECGVPEGVVWRLVEACGGMRIVIPAEPRPHHELVKFLGLEAARLLSGAAARQDLQIPRCTRLKRALRNRAIRADYDAGATANDLVLKYEVAYPTVRAALAEV